MRNWKKIEGFDFKEIIFEEYNHIAKITINRERYRNAFTPLTLWEMSQAFSYCRECQGIRVVILTGAGDKAFCSGGDMHVKGRGGYVGSDGVPRLNVLDVQMQIRRLPKPVIAMVNGYAIGGGHVLHVMCDLTIASENAIFGQTGPKVGSFDAGFGASYLARMVGQKKRTRNPVPLQAIYCQGSRRNGHGEQGSAFRPTGRYLCGMGRNHDGTLSSRPPHDQGWSECRT